MNVESIGGVAVITGVAAAVPEAVQLAYSRARGVSLARRAGVRVIYNSTDITADIAPWLLSLEFTDGLDKADDLQITLWDDGRWSGAWTPEHGAKLTAEIHLVEEGSASVLPCGVFTIDEVEYGGPPSTVAIRATSAAVTSDIRRDTKTRAWEKVTLQEIARTVAKKAGLSLLFSARNNPHYSRVDQRNQSDLDFLKSLAAREQLRLKVSDGKLILFAQSEFDAQASAVTFSKRDLRVTGYRFAAGVTTAYKQVVLKYRVPAAKKVYEFTYSPTDAPATGQILRLNERVESRAEAERVAKNRLAMANRGIREATLEVVGDVRLLAGQNVTVQGFGSAIDGAYSVEEAAHSLWPYSTSLTMRKVQL